MGLARDGSDHRVDHRDVACVEIGAEPSLLPRALDKGGDRPHEPLASPRDTFAPPTAVLHDQVLERTIRRGRLLESLEEADQRLPCIAAGERRLGRDRKLIDPFLEKLVEEGERIGGTELVSNESAELTIELEPGQYTYICTPHEAAGMTGTLTVS